MLTDSVMRIYRTTLIDPDTNLLNSASERHDILVDAVEQGGGGIVWYSVSSIEKDRVAQETDRRDAVNRR